MFSGTNAFLKRNADFPAVEVHFNSSESEKCFCDVKFVRGSNNELQRMQ